MPEQNEEYSREAYDEAEKGIEEAKNRINPEATDEELKSAVGDRQASQERRGRLHEMAWDEALEINKQYDALYAQKEQIDQEIADFRREKLGYGEEKAQETEQKEPTLEEWAGIYAEMQGVEDQAKILEAFQTLKAEMSQEDKEKLTMPIFCKEGLTTKSAWEMVAEENPTYKYIEPERIKTKGETGKATVAFTGFNQEADDDTLGENAKKAVDWEKTGESFMSPKVAMVAREAYRRLIGKQMDEKNVTMCPGSRSEDGDVPYLDFVSGLRGVDLSDVNPENRSPSFGVRRVVSKELES